MSEKMPELLRAVAGEIEALSDGPQTWHEIPRMAADELEQARRALRVASQFGDLSAARDFILDFLEGGDKHLNSLTTKGNDPTACKHGTPGAAFQCDECADEREQALQDLTDGDQDMIDWSETNKRLAGGECPHDTVDPESGTCWDCGRTVTEKDID